MGREVKLLEISGHGRNLVKQFTVERPGRKETVHISDHPEIEQAIACYLRMGYSLAGMSNGNGVVYILLER